MTTRYAVQIIRKQIDAELKLMKHYYDESKKFPKRSEWYALYEDSGDICFQRIKELKWALKILLNYI